MNVQSVSHCPYCNKPPKIKVECINGIYNVEIRCKKHNLTGWEWDGTEERCYIEAVKDWNRLVEYHRKPGLHKND